MEYLFKNAAIVTMDGITDVIENGYLGVKNGKISCIGKGQPDLDEWELENCRVKDCTDKVIMPGLINAHTHLPMTILRGYADDMPLHEWLFDKIFPAEAGFCDGDIERGARLGAAELIAGGVTCCADMYKRMPVIAQVIADSGMKANLSNGATCFCADNYDFETDKVTYEMRGMLDKYHNFDDGRILLDASIHAEYTSFDKVWRKNVEFAKENGLGMHVHLSETSKEHEECVKKYGKTPTEIFAEAGVFDVRTVAAHCVWITENDMKILKSKNVSAAHNPISNLKLASGIATIDDMIKTGVNIALGTDGASSNNNLDMFEEIKAAAVLAKTKSNNAEAVCAYEALKFATAGGAAALGRANECGKLAVGFDADIIMLDFDKPHLLPVHNVISSLCYAAHASDVSLTMCKGKVLYTDGEYKTLDIERIKSEARRKF